MFERFFRGKKESSEKRQERRSKNNYYDILGVDQNATQEEIKRAFRSLSKEHHPDVGGDSEKFKDISEAYTTLKDVSKRGIYDERYLRKSPRPSNYGHGQESSRPQSQNTEKAKKQRHRDFSSGFQGFDFSKKGFSFGDMAGSREKSVFEEAADATLKKPFFSTYAEEMLRNKGSFGIDPETEKRLRDSLEETQKARKEYEDQVKRGQEENEKEIRRLQEEIRKKYEEIERLKKQHQRR